MIKHFCDKCGEEVSKEAYEADKYGVTLPEDEMILFINATDLKKDQHVVIDWCRECILKTLIDNFDKWANAHESKLPIRVAESSSRSNY